MRYAPLALFASVLVGCQTVPSPDAAKSEIAQATQKWVSAFNACNASEAAALYDSEAVLWGTLAPVVISSPQGVRQYFERACASNPQPKVALGEQLVRVYGEMAINSGSYTFTVFPGGQARQFPARYSFTYRKRDGQWLIVDHHSSAVPAPPISASAPARQ